MGRNQRLELETGPEILALGELFVWSYNFETADLRLRRSWYNGCAP
jgi:hypothetical protein